jgi:hypothetical protein
MDRSYHNINKFREEIAKLKGVKKRIEPIFSTHSERYEAYSKVSEAESFMRLEYSNYTRHPDAPYTDYWEIYCDEVHD